jgi:Cys-rich protein (TIGR04453 family)
MAYAKNRMVIPRVLVWVSILGLSWFLASCKDIVEEECDRACSFFLNCVEADRNLNLTQQDKNTGKIQCVQGCTMIQGDVLRCYQEEPNSCEGFRECIIQSGALE